jgi:hypothetical protein
VSKHYYYIFGVRAQPATSDTPGKLSMDFLIDYTDDDIEKVELAKLMINNEILKTSKDEAVEACGLSRFSHDLFGASIRARVNMLSVHKIKSDFKMDDEMISTWVESCNYDKVAKQKLKEAEIRI